MKTGNSKDSNGHRKHKANAVGRKKNKKDKIEAVEGLIEGPANVPTYNSELLVSSWHARDELYRQLFGQYAYALPDNYEPPKLLKNKDNTAVIEAEFNIESNNNNLDVSNQRLAVLAYTPDPQRPYWTYVTAGLCTPWLQDEALEVSGFGVELMIKSPVEANWPAQVLRTMAYYIFNYMGTLSPGVRLALNAPIIPGGDSLLRNVLIWYPDEAPDCWYQLPSGGFGIFTAIGVTDDEMQLADSIHEEYGTWCMLQILRQMGIAQITDPDRPSVMKSANISSVIDSVKGFAEQFHQDFPDANRLNSCGMEEQN